MERGIRGGISVISHRHAEANNTYLTQFDESKPESYIMYLDANNLYGYSMMKPLPTTNFKWFNQDQKDNLNSSLESDELKSALNLVGPCVLSITFCYLEDHHDRFNDLPPAPVSRKIQKNELSAYAKKVQIEQELNYSNAPKLVADLETKKDYIIHHDNLKFLLELGGIKILNISNGITFSEFPWMKPYVDWASAERAKAKTDFEKDFYKLLVNSCYGKTLQNVYNYSDQRFAYDEGQVVRAMRKPFFKDCSPVTGSKRVFQLEFSQKQVMLNQPIYCGFSILEHSKILMFNFHYNVVKKNAPDAKLLFTDTDSLCYYFPETKNFLEIEDVKSVMDFSNYSKDDPLFDESVKKVPGYFKNESPIDNIIKFIGLRSKCYSYITESGKGNCNKAKGINQNVVKKTFNVGMYEEAILGVKTYANCVNFVQKNNNMYTINTSKMALNSYDDKRYLRDDGIESYAYGNVKIKREEKLAKRDFIENFF